MKEPGDKKGADMDAREEEAMSAADESGAGTPGRTTDSIAAGMIPAGPVIRPFGPELFEAEPAPQRPPAALHRLMTSLESRSGKRGARLAAITLQAGITPPAVPTELRGGEAVQAALWMELARENAHLRREAARLEERQHSLSRRIQRARNRVQELRLKLLERRLGVTLGSLRAAPPNPAIEPAATDFETGDERAQKD